MNYENFLEQVNLAEQLTSSDFRISTGSNVAIDLFVIRIVILF